MVGGEEIGNTQPQLSVPVCVLTFTAPNQTHLGLPGKAFLITIVFAKVIKSKQKKTKTSKQKNPKKRKTERVASWLLLQTP